MWGKEWEWCELQTRLSVSTFYFHLDMTAFIHMSIVKSIFSSNGMPTTLVLVGSRMVHAYLLLFYDWYDFYFVQIEPVKLTRA